MRKSRVAMLATTVLTLVCAAPAVAQEDAGLSKKQIAAMMQAQGGPVEAHKVLESLVGKFDGEVSFTFGPGMEMSMATTGESSWILGERFVQGMSGPAEGEELPFESQFTFGYDKRTSKYFVFGIDSTDTYSVFAEGEYDEETKTMTLLGENLEQSIGRTLPFKFIYTFAGDEDGNEGYTTAVWFQMEGAPGADEDGWFRVMRASMTRVKG